METATAATGITDAITGIQASRLVKRNRRKKRVEGAAHAVSGVDAIGSRTVEVGAPSNCNAMFMREAHGTTK